MTACERENSSSDQPLTRFYYDIPVGMEYPNIPEDNPMFVEKIELGRKLFFDPILSKDNSVSCGSCHSPSKAFSDSVAFSIGAENDLGDRNAPALMNVAYRTSFFKDGGVPTLELQILGPFDNELEFDLNIIDAIEKLKQDEEYVKAFKRVFNREPDPFGLTRAIAAYERTLISGESKYDKYVHMGQDLTQSELNGMSLFFSDELKCASCHSGNFFTNEAFENNGLLATYIDSGRARVTIDPNDAGRFAVPTLRNIELTAPYMFDGSLETLDEVIEHYASGGSNHRNKSDLITGFSITKEEKEDLIAFLKTLTDPHFLERHKSDDSF